MPPLSTRAQSIPSSPIRRLGPLAEAAEARGIFVRTLNIGQPDIETPPAMIAAYQAYDEKILAYGPSAGLPALRQAISAYYQRFAKDIQADDVFVTHGGSEALQFALASCCDPGDEVLVLEPFYANYASFSAYLGIHVKPVLCRVEDGFRLPGRAELDAYVGEKTKAILFSSPGNPSGAIYSKEELRRLGAFAEAHNLAIISDEVYREFTYDGHQATSVFELGAYQERMLVVDSVSKRFSACGARVGCLLTKNEAWKQAILRMSYARLCPATVDQLASVVAFSLPEDYFQPIVDEYQSRRDVLIEALEKIPGVFVRRPEGAFYTMVRLPVKDADAFCRFLLEDFSDGGESVMLAPGTGFYASPGGGQDEVRMAYVHEKSYLQRAIQILERALAVYPSKKA